MSPMELDQTLRQAGAEREAERAAEEAPGAPGARTDETATIHESRWTSQSQGAAAAAPGAPVAPAPAPAPAPAQAPEKEDEEEEEEEEESALASAWETLTSLPTAGGRKSKELVMKGLNTAKEMMGWKGDVDPSSKDFNIGMAQSRKISPARVEAELAKCVCLCMNCHAKVHAGIITLAVVDT